MTNAKINVKKEMVLSLVAGLIGGLLGYFLGAWADNVWVSYILFFGFGFAGYRLTEINNVRQGIKKFFLKTLTRWLSRIWEITNTICPFPYLSIPIGIYALFVTFASMNSSASGLVLNPVDIYDYSLANIHWMETGYNSIIDKSYGGSYNNRLGTYIGGWFSSGLIGLMFMFGSAWGMIFLSSIAMDIYEVLRKSTMRGFLRGTGAFFRTAGLFFGGLFLTIAFYLIIGWVLLLIKGLSALLLSLHTWRRLATGISTTIGGAIYIAFVPFSIGSVPLGIAGIGCALICGIAASLVALLLGADKAKTFLRKWQALRLPHFIPDDI
jgi:hypothetical protein